MTGRAYVDIRFFLSEDVTLEQIQEQLESRKPERLDIKAISWKRLKYGIDQPENNAPKGHDDQSS